MHYLERCIRHQEHVGSVSYVSVDYGASGSGRGVVVASEAGMLAVLDPGDGSVGGL